MLRICFDFLKFIQGSASENPSDDARPKRRKKKKSTAKEKRQKRRNRGKSYVNAQNKIVEKRRCEKLKDCQRRCNLSITRGDQKLNFNKHWNQGSYLKRKANMRNLVDVCSKHRCRSKDENDPKKFRRYSVKYSLETESDKVQVCQRCFLATLGETKAFVENLAKQIWENSEGLPDQERRGKRIPVNRLSDEKVAEVRAHIAKFPAYESHYGRSHSSKKYLPSDLSISKMYKLYVAECESPVGETRYREIFADTGIKFKPPKIDTCHKCDLLAVQLKYEADEDRKKEVLELRKKHLDDVDSAFEVKAKDKRAAKDSNGSMIMCSFDLQQCLRTPSLSTSIAFYKRALWTYNLTVNNNTMSETTCYMWNETVSKRGSNEITSCIYKFLGTVSVDHVVLFSDSCYGQNKNKTMMGMLSISVANHPTLKIVDHKFLEPGHTHMECDTDHSVIERAKKRTNKEIHWPDDWYQFVRDAKSSNPFRVVVLDQSDIFRYDELYKGTLVVPKRCQENALFRISDVKWLRYVKEEQGIVRYKNTLSEDDPFFTLDLREEPNAKLDDHLVPCNQSTLPITKEKKKDLLSLLPLLREDVHCFYENLPQIYKATEVNVDPDLDFIDSRGNLDESATTVSEQPPRTNQRKSVTRKVNAKVTKQNKTNKTVKSQPNVQTSVTRKSARLQQKKK